MITPIEFTIENYTITYRVNWLGIETIFVNGKKVSKKLSIGKRVHTFKLLVNGTLQVFYIESKQSFSGSYVKVQLFKNSELIDTDYVRFFEAFNSTQTSAPKEDNSMFVFGILFIVLTLCFGWSNLFLFLGLIFLFSALNNKTSKATSGDNNTIEPKE